MAAFRDLSMVVAIRSLALAWALLGVWIAMACFLDLSMAGFPDGYITPYARSTRMPLTILAWLCLAQSFYFVFRALRGKHLGLVRLCIQMLAAASLTVLPIRIVQTCPQWEGCSQAYQFVTGTMMDDGSGG